MFIKKMNKSKQRINKYNTFEDKIKLIIIIIIRYISFDREQIIKIIISLNNFFQNNNNNKIIHSYIFHNYSNNNTKNILNYNIIKNKEEESLLIYWKKYNNKQIVQFLKNKINKFSIRIENSFSFHSSFFYDH